MTAEQLKKEFKIRAVPIFTVAILGLTLILTGCAPEKAVATATPPSPTPDRAPTAQGRFNISDIFDHICKGSKNDVETLTITLQPGQEAFYEDYISFRIELDRRLSYRADKQLQLTAGKNNYFNILNDPKGFGFADLGNGNFITTRRCERRPTSNSEIRRSSLVAVN